MCVSSGTSPSGCYELFQQQVSGDGGRQGVDEARLVPDLVSPAGLVV